ncbi:MAG: HoxN/HupN/NixA family nickel/cobalt transporter [Phycisphaerae bacterium]
MSPAASPSDARRAAFLIGCLVAVGILLWALAVSAFMGNKALLALATLATVFGLRHALDADHIAAIDNITRRLMDGGRRQITVGLMFSLGHSTVVIALALLVIFSVQQVRASLSHLMSFGGIFGGAVSALLLLLVGGANLFALWKSIGRARSNTGSEVNAESGALATGGIYTKLLGRVLSLVNSNWKIYGIGFLFGLGFDTASEISILVMSGAAASRGMPLWHCLLFPLLFTSGMTLVDTLDNILILSAYKWALTTPRGTRYYNAAMTLTTIFMALGIAVIEGFGLLLPSNAGARHGVIASWVTVLNDHFASIGAVFVMATGAIWLGLWLLYRMRTASSLRYPIA